MLAWLRKIRIRRINLFGVELEFDHSAIDTAKPGEVEAPAEPREARRLRPTVEGGHSATLTVYGEVIGTIDKDLGLRIRNAEEAREFWQTHGIDTKLDWMGKGPPVFSINRKADAARCKPGDEASMTVVVQDRVGGKRGTKTVGFERLSKP